MSDFASAAMLRVLHAGMRRIGLQSPAQQWLSQATVPLNAKQQLVGLVLQARGVSALLQLGQGLHELKRDSLMPMLIRPGQPLAALQAWLRLERYLHSKHRIEQTLLSPQAVQHRHISIKADSSPSAAEDLVVLGVLIALLQSAGCQSVQAELENGLQIWPLIESSAQQSALKATFSSAQTHIWRISWSALDAQPAHSPPAPMQIEQEASLVLSERIARLTAQTVGEALPLDQVAQVLGHSTRSLQRKLKLEGTRYVDIIASSRAERASKMLSESHPSLAEIGFACGYTDQAHFCRDFKRRVGMGPLTFRAHATTIVHSSTLRKL